MNRPASDNKENSESKAPLPLWSAIILVIVLMVGAVSLFGGLIFLLITGAQRLGFSPIVYVAIFVIISGVFAWLVKRLSDILLRASRLWFSEETDE